MMRLHLRQRLAYYLAVYGCISTALLYIGIGTVAILSFLKIKDGGADEGSLLVYLENYLLGKVAVWIILTGTVSYIIWRFYEAYHDPYKYGTKPKGLSLRTAVVLSTVADLLIVYSSLQAIVGFGDVKENGQPDELRKMVSEILGTEAGPTLLISTASIILITALTQFVYGSTKGYSERIDIDHLGKMKKKTIHGMAIYGYFSRGVILAIIGYFLFKAVIENNAQLVVNTDKAFDFIGDDIGHFYFIFIAAGTISYGLFMLLLGLMYDADKD